MSLRVECDNLFMGVGRVSDGVPLAWLQRDGAETQTDLEEPIDIFRKLLAAAGVMMQPGQRTTLQWKAYVFCCAMGASGDTLAAVVTSSTDREVSVYQMLQEFHTSALQGDGWKTVGEGGLNIKLMPMMAQIFGMRWDVLKPVLAKGRIFVGNEILSCWLELAEDDYADNCADRCEKGCAMM